MLSSKLKSLIILITVILSAATAYAQDYRVLFPGPKPFSPKIDTVSVVMIGDVMMHSKQLEYDYRTFLEPIRSRLEKADLAVANMEFSLAGKPYSGYPAFSAPDGYADYIADCGVDVFLLANNHVLDKGATGMVRTLDVYDRMTKEGRIRYTGASRDAEADSLSNPLMLSVKGVRIALINFTYGSNQGNPNGWPKLNLTKKDEIKKAITVAKQKKADVIIALPHWGTEYVLKHGKTQDELAQWLASQGVDLVIGAHPHVIQDTQTIGKTKVIYSMGNAISNMSAKYTRLELMVKLKFVCSHGMQPVKVLEPELEFMWCTLPGTLTDSYATIPVKEYIGKKDLWKQSYDYDNMIATYEEVKAVTGIED